MYYIYFNCQGLIKLFILICFFSLCVNTKAFSDKFSDTIEICQSCHAKEVINDNPEVPVILGQHFYYIYTQLKDYKSERRTHEIMSEIAKELDKETMKKLATYYSKKQWINFTSNSEYDPKVAERTIVAGQCVQCHGDYKGLSGTPRLAGQKETYLFQTMKAFNQKIRLNSGSKTSLFSTITDEEIKSLSVYLSNK